MPTNVAQYVQDAVAIVGSAKGCDTVGDRPTSWRPSPVVTCGLVRLIAEPRDDDGWRPIGVSVVEDVPPEKVEQALAMLTLEGNQIITFWNL
jgi:hypothetical protein